MDLHYAWLSLGVTQKVAFHFVFVVSAMTAIRAARLVLWRLHRAAGSSSERRRQTVRQWARSTRGLARAALWFMCAAGAGGLAGAYDILVNSNRPVLAHIIESSLHVLDATAVGLGLCGLLLVASLVFDVVADLTDPGMCEAAPATACAASRRRRLVVMLRSAGRLPGPVGVALIAATLIDFRPTFAAELGTKGDLWVGTAGFQALGLLWWHLTPVAAAMGLASWVGVLVERAFQPLHSSRADYRASVTNAADGGCA
jgi:hypothetical protein